jgi:hypothetical protein
MTLYVRLVYDDGVSSVVAGNAKSATELTLNDKRQALCEAGWVCNGPLALVNRNHELLQQCRQGSVSGLMHDVDRVVTAARKMGLEWNAQSVEQQLFKPDVAPGLRCFAQALIDVFGQETVGAVPHLGHVLPYVSNLPDVQIAEVFRRAIHLCGFSNDLPGFTQLQRELLMNACLERHVVLLDYRRSEEMAQDPEMRRAINASHNRASLREREQDEMVPILQRVCESNADDFSILIDEFDRRHGFLPRAVEKPVFSFPLSRRFREDLLKASSYLLLCTCARAQGHLSFFLSLVVSFCSLSHLRNHADWRG